MQVEAYIIMNDSIRAIALKYLLNEYFGVKAVVASRFESELIADKSASIIYVVSPDVVVFNHDFFVTKRQRTIIVAAMPNDALMTITPDMDEEFIVNVLNRAIE